MTNKNHFDVLVIGAGPAGSIFAYELKKAKPNIDILVVEKETMPRYKVCGGGLQVKSAKILPFSVESVIEDVIFSITFSHKCKKQFTRAYDKPIIYNVMRDKFDAYLIQKAQELGVFLLDGHTVKHINVEKGKIFIDANSRHLTCNILIGADGVMSIVAKSFGLMKNVSLSLGIESEISVSPNILKKNKGNIILDCGTGAYKSWGMR